LKKNKFVIVTQYFPPEIGGGSQRSIGFAEELKKLDYEVVVITPFPSYLISKEKINVKLKLYEKTTNNEFTIYRTFVFASDRGNFLKRMLYYLSFAISASIVVAFCIKKTNFIMTVSPPLFTGIVGIIGKKIKKCKFIFDIGDLWPESAIRLGFLKNKLAIKMASQFETYIYRQSDYINVVTRLTFDKLKSSYPFIKRINYIPNFVDTATVKKVNKNCDYLEKFDLNGKIVFGYAGNVGSAQGIKIITDAAFLLKDVKDIKFLIVGDGVDKSLIQEEIVKHNLSNVLLVPPVSRDEILKVISVFDFMIIPLVKNELFKITIPSKLYESMAAEIPVLLCVDGEARKIVEKYNCGLFVEPENSEMLAQTIENVMTNPGKIKELGENGRRGALEEFDRNKIISTFSQLINE
jgi:glycosyltransferase involved in cell wall biosynthesis